LFCCVLAAPASATWSVVLYNRVTGECGVAVTSCVPGFSVGQFVPVLVVGEGAAAAQSFVDQTGATRIRIRDGIRNGESPAAILAALSALDPQHQTRQYGIAGSGGAPVAFSGTQNGAAALHRTGSIGDWDYAIQGNVLTGAPVIIEAERALLASNGDSMQLLLAALEGGRIFGGDGRCSCSQSAPTSCGSPPASFTHTATSAWVAVARIGDTDGGCGAGGCAQGNYFLLQQFHNGNATIDPVTELIRRVRVWRTAQLGRADHYLSEVIPGPSVLQADNGLSNTTVFVRLVDIAGVPLAQGGASVFLTRVGDPIALPNGVVNFGDGSYALSLGSTSTPGTALFTVNVNHGSGRIVQLWPPLEIESVVPRDLHIAVPSLSVSAGNEAPFVLRRPSDAGRAYRVLGSFSGTQPGTPLSTGLVVPLVRDRLFEATVLTSGSPPFRDFQGVLDPFGEANPRLELPAGALAPLIGATLHFAAVIDATAVTNVASLPIVP